jgi:Protein kinase domain
MGVVYLAEHLRLKKKVALKVLPPELAEDEDFRLRFERESQIAASLDHPNVVTVHDAGEAEGLLYIAMRYVEGTDLAQLIRDRGPLEVGRALDILSQAAEGLDEAHSRGLVHRDVKPANILLAPSPRGGERVYLSDFGLAKEWAATRMTRSGFFVGTIHYSPPEQFKAEQLDGRTDVYSLGCVLFECLSGRVPFNRGSDPAVMYAHLNDPPPSLSALRPDLPTSIDSVIATAMAKSKEDRYATCGQLAEAAEGTLRREQVGPPTAGAPLAAEPTAGPIGPAATRRAATASTEAIRAAPHPPEAGPPMTGEPARPPRRGWMTRRGWWVAAAVVLVMALGLGSFLFLRSEGPGDLPEGARLLRPAHVDATNTAEPGIDACGEEVPFVPERLIDGDPTTAWRTAGNGVGEELILSFDREVRILRIGLIPGYAKIDPCDGTDRFPENRVIQRVQYRFPARPSSIQEFEASPTMQYVDLDVETTVFSIVILETEPQGDRNYTVISEVEVYGMPVL